MKWNTETKRFEVERKPKKIWVEDDPVELTIMPTDWLPAWFWLQEHLRDGCPHQGMVKYQNEIIINESEEELLEGIFREETVTGENLNLPKLP